MKTQKLKSFAARPLTDGEIRIGLLQLSDLTDMLSGHKGLANVDEIINGAMQIVNEHAALVAVAEAAQQILAAFEHKKFAPGFAPAISLKEAAEKLAALAAIREEQ